MQTKSSHRPSRSGSDSRPKRASGSKFKKSGSDSRSSSSHRPNQKRSFSHQTTNSSRDGRGSLSAASSSDSSPRKSFDKRNSGPKKSFSPRSSSSSSERPKYASPYKKSSFRPRDNSRPSRSYSSSLESSSTSTSGPFKVVRNSKFDRNKKSSFGSNSGSSYRSSSSSSRPSSFSRGGRSGDRPGRVGGSRGYEGHNKGSRSSGGRSSGGRGGGRKMPTFDPSDFIKRNPVNKSLQQAQGEESIYKAKNTFATFGLDEKLVETVTEMGITIPSPIQDQIIPEIMNGRDVIGLAETGTGKTAAFLLPIIQKTIKEHDVRRTTLILAPTRELAIQIEDELKKLSKNFRIYSTVCVGGVNIRPQIKGLGRRNHFIIGTPGRVLDLIKRGTLKTEEVTTVVLDEADRMLDMGFIVDMREILKNTPKTRETLFFSATTSKETEKIVNDFLNDPVTISVKKQDVTNQIEQDIVTYPSHRKFETLTDMLANVGYNKVLVFGAMKHSVKQLAQELSAAGIKSESIHGNKTHVQRQRSLARFKAGDVRVLVATDVAARGIHVDNVSHVINYDLPSTFQDYVHRIGRTGRGDKRGKALTFVQENKR